MRQKSGRETTEVPQQERKQILAGHLQTGSERKNAYDLQGRELAGLRSRRGKDGVSCGE